LALYFPAPASFTGDDVVELHCHGSRAVVRRIEAELNAIPGFRPAEAGEFTRRALENGKLDLIEAEGLADLLAAETELQRQAAVAQAGGAFSRLVADWTERVLHWSARIEAELDFSDEGEVGEGGAALVADVSRETLPLLNELGKILARPRSERLRDGVRVLLAGPTNAGKSTLLNAIVQREAAIVSPIAGTTRDLIEVPVAIDGVPYLFIDSAGIRETEDEIEAIGVSRARAEMARADLVLWLGAEQDAPDHPGVWPIATKADLNEANDGTVLSVSATTGEGMAELLMGLNQRAGALLPKSGEVALNTRQRQHLRVMAEALKCLDGTQDLLIAAEHLRTARVSLDRLTGRCDTEAVLDSLFGRFCIGK
jgi:tRNA modification GTPase